MRGYEKKIKNIKKYKMNPRMLFGKCRFSKKPIFVNNVNPNIDEQYRGHFEWLLNTINVGNIL